MRARHLIAQSLRHYRGTHAAVVAGVALAVAVLAGALALGDSVRASLAELARQRIGGADAALVALRPFDEALSARVREDGGARDAAPLLALSGVADAEDGARRAGDVRVYGVDARFWAFHGRADLGPSGRDVLVSRPLAEELHAAPGDTVLVRVTAPEDVPGASLFGRREGRARALRVRVARVLEAGELGEFALRPQQQPVRAAFVPLALLQRTLAAPGRANTVLLAGLLDPERVLGASRLADLGVRVRAVRQGRVLAVESATALVDPALEAAAASAAGSVGSRPERVMTYLATEIHAAGGAIPYSVVAALWPTPWPELDLADGTDGPPPIVLNDWAASGLRARVGDTVTLEYLLWHEEGRMDTGRAEFAVARIVPIEGVAADPDLTPEYPGITAATRMSEWDPPFPVDLSRVGDRDEEYWERHRATPKAFVSLAVAQRLWAHRLGALTSVRAALPDGAPTSSAQAAFETALRGALDPAARGLELSSVREGAAAAARSGTDFAGYFAGFSLFLLAAALLLAALFFRLGLEQRAREFGLLRATGFSAVRLVRVALAEGAVLAVLGAALGLLLAIGWAALLLLALRTVWVDAVGTRALTLHVTPGALLFGATGGLLAAVATIAWTVRALARSSPQRLLSGRAFAAPASRAPGRARGVAVVGALMAAALLLASGTGRLAAAAGFFGGAALLLVAAVAAQLEWLRRGALARRAGVIGLGWRSAGDRPGRSALSIALIAMAGFLVVAVGVFRRAPPAADDPRAGTGGYALLAESVEPLHHDLRTADGRAALGLSGAESAALEGAAVARFRLRPGDDASCLNLYRPGDPRLLAPEPAFLREGRFTFHSSLARTEEERKNPWQLLDREAEDGAIPVVGDHASLQYVLKLGLGDVMEVPRPGRAPLRLRVVGALQDSLFQGELLTGETHFTRAFPEIEGYRVLLVGPAAGREGDVAAALESGLRDQGVDVTRAADRLAAYHQVENTYLSTFQALGALALVLGTFGLATVLARNVLERRRELALLRAVGFRAGDLGRMVMAEDALLVGLGLATGLLCALIAVLPAARARGGVVPWGTITLMLSGVLVAALLAGRGAVALTRRGSLVEDLKSE